MFVSFMFREGAGNLFKTFPGRRCILVAHEGRLVYDAWEKTWFAVLHAKSDLNIFERFMVDRRQKTEVLCISSDSRTQATLIATKEHYAPGAGPWEQIELDSAAKTVSALLIGVLVTTLG